MEQEAGPEPPRDPSRHDPSLGDLLARLFGETETLLRLQLALVRTEIGESVARTSGAALLFVAALATGFAGALGLIAAVVLLLSLVMAPWLACALVGAVVLGAGAGLALYARRLLAQASFIPDRTIQSLRGTADWAREEFM